MFGHGDNNAKQGDPIGSAHDDIAASAEAIANDRQSDGGTLGSFMSGANGGGSNGGQTFISPASNSTPTPSADPIDTPAAATADASDSAPAALPGRLGVATGADTDGLLTIKQQALQSLTPLVSQLNQTPEEQFRTTMMMIQASDNHSLLQVAYEAAQKISDEKERAQALLDIVNEINYFTQQQ